MNSATTRGRRWPVALLVLGGAALVVLSVAGGAARSTADATSSAVQFLANGRYASAIAVDRVVAQRTSPLYLLDRGDVQAAHLNEGRTMLAWAAAIDRQGRVEQAVAMAGLVTDPELAPNADQERGQLLLEAARADAARGDFGSALQHLDQVTALGIAGTIAGEVAQIEPQYEISEAAALVGFGDGINATALLDAASQSGPAGAAAAAPAYPHALLLAGMQAIAQQSFREAAAQLQRLVSSYAASVEARQARTLLREPQPVAGTLVDRAGMPLSGQIRLSSHFYNQSSGYLTTGPFYYAYADSDGDFRFGSVPQGGPYVLEVFRGGDWMTFIDPATGQPANPVSVTPLQPVDLAYITVP